MWPSHRARTSWRSGWASRKLRLRRVQTSGGDLYESDCNRRPVRVRVQRGDGEGPGAWRWNRDRRAGTQGPVDCHSQREASAAPAGHGREEAPDAADDRGREVQRQHPPHHRRGDRPRAPDHRRPVGRPRGRRHADDRWRAREGQDPGRPDAADQGRRRRLHSLRAAPRREWREREHHVAQRALGHRLAAGFADGRRHRDRTARTRRAAVAVRRCPPGTSRRCRTATAAAASCSSRRSNSTRSWPACV